MKLLLAPIEPCRHDDEKGNVMQPQPAATIEVDYLNIHAVQRVVIRIEQEGATGLLGATAVRLTHQEAVAVAHALLAEADQLMRAIR